MHNIFSCQETVLSLYNFISIFDNCTDLSQDRNPNYSGKKSHVPLYISLQYNINEPKTAENPHQYVKITFAIFDIWFLPMLIMHTTYIDENIFKAIIVYPILPYTQHYEHYIFHMIIYVLLKYTLWFYLSKIPLKFPISIK